MAFDQATLAQLESNYSAPAPSAPQKSSKVQNGGLKGILAGLLPTIGGALGAVGGSFIAPIAGTAAGGAAGSALGEALKERLSGQGLSVKNIATQGALGAIPGVFKSAKAAKGAYDAGVLAKDADASAQAASQLAASQSKNIPIKFVQSTTQGSPISLSKGIPIKSIESTSSGSGVPQTINKTLTDPSIQDLQDATNSLNGYSTNVKVGKITGRQGLNGKNFTVFERSAPKSVVNLQGSKTVAPIIPGTETSRIIPAHPSSNVTKLNFGPTTEKVLPSGGIVPESTQSISSTGIAPQSSPSLLGKLSTNLTKSGSGVKVGKSVGDINRVDQDAQTLQRLGIKGTPNAQLKKISDVMASHGAVVDNILSKSPIMVDGNAVKGQIAQAIDDPTKFADLDLSTPGAQRALNMHLDKFAGATDAKQVNDYIKVLNPIAAKAQDKLVRGVTLTDKETAALAAKKAGDEVLGQFPDIKPYKQDMATLFDRNPEVAKEAEKTQGIPLLGIKSKTAAQLTDAAKSNLGAATSKIDTVAQGAKVQNVKKVGKSLFSQLTTRAAVVPLLSSSAVPNSSDRSDDTSQTLSLDGTDPSLLSGNQATTDTPATDYEAEGRQALAAGNYKAFDAIMQLADLSAKTAASNGTTAKPLSAASAVTVNNALSGLSSLNTLAGIIGQSGVPKAELVPGRGVLGGVVGNALGTSSYDTAAKNISDVITRLRSGAAISPQEAAFYNSQLPQAFDSPQTIQEKLGLFQQLFSGVANMTGPSATDSTDSSTGQ